MKTLSAILLLSIAVIACGDDSDSADASIQLTQDEREWCSFADASEASAERFDLIFDAGLILDLPMDALNAQAAGLTDEYLAEGMTRDEATHRVSDELLEVEQFMEACQLAYANATGG